MINAYRSQYRSWRLEILRGKLGHCFTMTAHDQYIDDGSLSDVEVTLQLDCMPEKNNCHPRRTLELEEWPRRLHHHHAIRHLFVMGTVQRLVKFQPCLALELAS